MAGAQRVGLQRAGHHRGFLASPCPPAGASTLSRHGMNSVGESQGLKLSTGVKGCMLTWGHDVLLPQASAKYLWPGRVLTQNTEYHIHLILPFGQSPTVFSTPGTIYTLVLLAGVKAAGQVICLGFVCFFSQGGYQRIRSPILSASRLPAPWVPMPSSPVQLRPLSGSLF